MLEQGGQPIEDSGSWAPTDEMLFGGAQQVIGARTTYASQETGVFIAPLVYNDITYLLYEDTDLKIGWATKSLSRSSPANSFIYHDNWELITLAEDAE